LVWLRHSVYVIKITTFYTIVHMSILDFIDKVVYINLPHRQDRKQHMEQTWRSVFPSMTVYSATPYTKEDLPRGYSWARRGYYGAWMSHVAVATAHFNSGADNVLILEDDSVPRHDFANMARLVWESTPRNFSVINYGVSEAQNGQGAVPVNYHVVRVRRARRTTACLLSRLGMLEYAKFVTPCIRGSAFDDWPTFEIQSKYGYYSPHAPIVYAGAWGTDAELTG
jgi:hypothetical protein